MIISNSISKPTIFVDGTNIVITQSNLTDFKEEINIVVEKISNWFQNNLLILNFNKTYYMHFMTKSKFAVDIHISHKVNPIVNTYSTISWVLLWIVHCLEKHTLTI